MIAESQPDSKRNPANLFGKRILVFGGTGGIGFPVSLDLLSQGAKICFLSRDQRQVQRLFGKSMNSKGYSSVEANLLDLDTLANQTELAIESLGGVDACLFMAGTQHRESFLNFPVEKFREILTVNLEAPFIISQRVGAHFKKQRKGKFVFFSSLTQQIAIPNISAYGVSKGGLSQLAKSIASELGPHGVNANLVAPGRIYTRMTQDVLSPKHEEDNLARIPMGRFGSGADLVGATVYLLSNSSDYMNGQTIFVDGGWLATGGNAQR